MIYKIQCQLITFYLFQDITQILPSFSYYNRQMKKEREKRRTRNEERERCFKFEVNFLPILMPVFSVSNKCTVVFKLNGQYQFQFSKLLVNHCLIKTGSMESRCFICSQYMTARTSRHCICQSHNSFRVSRRMPGSKRRDKIKNFNLFALGISHLSFTCCCYFTAILKVCS